MSEMAASAIFDRKRLRRNVHIDRQLLNAAARMDRFSISDVSIASCGALGHYSRAKQLLSELRREGHLRQVSRDRARPLVLEWADVDEAVA